MKNYYVHETAIIDDGCLIGKNSQIWHFSHLMSGCRIGNQCNIGQNVFIASGVEIGNGVKIQNNVSLYSGVICEDDVFLGPSCVFTNVINPRSFINRKEEFRTTYIEKGATIGANATIICGNRIGKYSLIAAGAVIAKDVPPYSLWIGNPARQTGWVSRNGHKLHFNEMGEAFCPETDEKYQLVEGSVIPIIP